MTGVYIPDRSHAGSVGKNGFTTGIQDPCVHIRVDDAVLASVLNISRQHITAGTHRPAQFGLIASIQLSAGIQVNLT